MSQSESTRKGHGKGAKIPVPRKGMLSLPQTASNARDGETNPELPALQARNSTSKPSDPNAEEQFNTPILDYGLLEDSSSTSQSLEGDGSRAGPSTQAEGLSQEGFEYTGNPSKKRKSRSRKRDASVYDVLKEKLALYAKSPRVKSTEELLTSLQKMKRGKPMPIIYGAQKEKQSSSRMPKSYFSGNESKEGDVSGNGSEELLSKDSVDNLVEASKDSERPYPLEKDDKASKNVDGKMSSSPALTFTSTEDYLKNVLYGLPPIDYHALSEDEDDNKVPLAGTISKKARKQAAEELADRVCSGEQIENVTGNYGLDENNERVFKEWHESVNLKTDDERLIVALPYVIID